MDTKNKSHLTKLDEYSTLIEAYLSNKIDALSFEREYLAKFKADSTNWSDREFEVLNSIFTDLDAFCSDPSLRDELDIDEFRLRENTNRNLKNLQAIMNAE
jgi:hypothetical protein